MRFDLIFNEITQDCDRNLLPPNTSKQKYIEHTGKKGVVYSPKLQAMGTYRAIGFSDGAKFGKIRIRRDFKNKPYISHMHDLVLLLHELGHHKLFVAAVEPTKSVSGFDYKIKKESQLSSMLREEGLAWLSAFAHIWRTKASPSFDFKHKLVMSVYIIPWALYYYLSYWRYTIYCLLSEFENNEKTL